MCLSCACVCVRACVCMCGRSFVCVHVCVCVCFAFPQAVELESPEPDSSRYLAIISFIGVQEHEESICLGVEYRNRSVIGQNKDTEIVFVVVLRRFSSGNGNPEKNHFSLCVRFIGVMLRAPNYSAGLEYTHTPFQSPGPCGLYGCLYSTKRVSWITLCHDCVYWVSYECSIVCVYQTSLCWCVAFAMTTKTCL